MDNCLFDLGFGQPHAAFLFNSVKHRLTQPFYSIGPVCNQPPPLVGGGVPGQPQHVTVCLKDRAIFLLLGALAVQRSFLTADANPPTVSEPPLLFGRRRGAQPWNATSEVPSCPDRPGQDDRCCSARRLREPRRGTGHGPKKCRLIPWVRHTFPLARTS